MKKHRYYHKLALLLILMTALVFALTGCNNADDAIEVFASDTSEPQNLIEIEGEPPIEVIPVRRDYRTQLKGNGEDVVTLMVYLCGSDLESQGGAATKDLVEIVMAEGNENLNIVVETGGAKRWANNYMNPDLNQRWQVKDNDLFLLESTEARDMSKGGTLSDFISFSAENFPADRYLLVLWDHGGGTVDGYAYDERFGNYSMMSLSEMDEALDDAGVAFDMLGFDCCLMSTAEIAFMAEKYADYMIASQRVEPGNGWYYTPWIDALSLNTSIPTEELGKVIVDGFIEECKDGYYGHELTLAVTDLTYIPELFDTMYDFFSKSQAGLAEGDTFVSTSRALGNSRAMQDKYDLVDMAFLIESMDGSEELLNKFNQCVVYNGTTIENHNGLCLYFPYTNLNQVGDALTICEQIGIDESYRNFIKAYANMMLGGQAYNSGGNGNPLSGDDFDLNYWLGTAWADEDEWTDLLSFFEDNSYDSSNLVIEEKGDGYVLSLSEEDWDLITDFKMRVLLDDGEGYIDLGSQYVYEFDEDGDLLISYDNTWWMLDGNFVCCYVTGYEMENDKYNEGDEYYIYGVVPIQYEGDEAELVLIWDNEHPDGYVAGWRYTYVGIGSQKGLFDVQDGMYFDFLCDYYTYDGEYEDQYFFGGMTVDGPITVSYDDVGDDDTICLMYYELTDIYGNNYWTEHLFFSWSFLED